MVLFEGAPNYLSATVSLCLVQLPPAGPLGFHEVLNLQNLGLKSPFPIRKQKHRSLIGEVGGDTEAQDVRVSSGSKSCPDLRPQHGQDGCNQWQLHRERERGTGRGQSWRQWSRQLCHCRYPLLHRSSLGLYPPGHLDILLRAAPYFWAPPGVPTSVFLNSEPSSA